MSSLDATNGKRSGQTFDSPEPKRQKTGNKCILFIGNPGSGKSTLLNGLIGKTAFKSGVSYGKGLTTAFQYEMHSGIHFGDTPGLADIVMRQRAAEELEKSLKLDGDYRIVFVILLDAGRIRPADLSTVKLVVEAVSVEFPYAVIINKLSPRIINDMNTNEQARTAILSGLNCADFRPPSDVYFYPSNADLADVDTALHTPPAEFVDWIDNLPSCLIAPASVATINTTEFDKMFALFETKMEEQKRMWELDAERREREVTDLLRKLEEERERADKYRRKKQKADLAAQKAADEAYRLSREAEIARQQQQYIAYQAPTPDPPEEKKEESSSWCILQ